MKAVKYIIILAVAAIGIYNLIGWFGQTSSMPLFFALECFCLCGVVALHKEEHVCEQE